MVDPSRPAPESVWSADLGRAVEYAPLGHADAWFISITSGPLLRVHATTGRQEWKRKLAGAPRQAPVLCDGRLILATDYEVPQILSLDPTTGEVMWKVDTPLSLVDAEGPFLICVDRRGGVTRRDPHTSQRLWDLELPGAGWRLPRVRLADSLAVISVRPDSLIALQVETGARRWATRIGPWPGVGTGPLLTAIADDSTLVTLDPADGAVLARRKLPCNAAGVAVSADSTVFLALRNGSVWALNQRLEIQWEQDLEPPLVSSPTLLHEFLIQGGARGTVHVLMASSGEPWAAVPVPELVLGTPGVYGDLLAVPGDKGTVTVFRRPR